MEIWKIVDGTDGRLEVSNMGNFKSPPVSFTNTGKKYSHNGRTRKPTMHNQGYMVIKVSHLNRTIRVHTLVARTFIPNPNNYPWVNHKNGIKTDNRAENLEWCSPKENSQHAIENGLLNPLKGEKHPLSKITDMQVAEMRDMHKTGNYSYAEIACKYRMSIGNASLIINRKSWKHVA